MQLDSAFDVTAPIDQVWSTLMDFERVAACLPGAQVLNTLSEDAYQVGMKIKLGPVTMQYKGQLEVVERHPEEHRATLRGKAKEARGQGTAEATAQLALTSDGTTTHGTVTANVNLSGRAAAMGQGVINTVTEQMMAQFATNLQAMLAAGDAPATAATAASSTATAGTAAPSDTAAGATAARKTTAKPAAAKTTGAKGTGAKSTAAKSTAAKAGKATTSDTAAPKAPAAKSARADATPSEDTGSTAAASPEAPRAGSGSDATPSGTPAKKAAPRKRAAAKATAHGDVTSANGSVVESPPVAADGSPAPAAAAADAPAAEIAGDFPRATPAEPIAADGGPAPAGTTPPDSTAAQPPSGATTLGRPAR
ncbi:SRPBCC family protein, partial [Cryptosporangium minutisporangium]|uniref:SRPBCC family protein n=1 Tax=Cryptosporangium minutisporangium TaxID=113569 RepID=UPI0035E81BCA